MDWTSPPELRVEARRLWQRGLPMRALVMPNETLFPRRLRLEAPTSAQLSEHFEAAREWIAALRKTPEVRIDWKSVRHRVLGNNEVPCRAVPCRVWLDSPEAAAKFVGESAAFKRFERLLALTASTQPRLVDWLARYPHRVLDVHEDWPRLLDVVNCFEHRDPAPVYPRQIDLPGLHSKFIEGHRGLLASLLDHLAAEPTASTGVRGFARRHGLLEAPLQVRLRSLDAGLELLPGTGARDISLEHAAFARLRLPVTKVFVTENLVNFLAFPARRDALVLFGAGYGFEPLADAGWLAEVPIAYWGDIDTHGFAILDQFRSRFPHASSLLMDEATLLAHRPLWGSEPRPQSRDLSRLTASEQALYDALRDNRFGDRVRLEQERVGFAWVRERLG